MASKKAWLRFQATPGLVKMPLIWTPTTRIFNEERDAAIVAALKAGVSTKELAAMHGLSTPRIQQIGQEGGLHLKALRAEQRRQPKSKHLGHGAKGWWAQYTKEERSAIVAERQRKRWERVRSTD